MELERIPVEIDNGRVNRIERSQPAISDGSIVFGPRDRAAWPGC